VSKQILSLFLAANVFVLTMIVLMAAFKEKSNMQKRLARIFSANNKEDEAKKIRAENIEARKEKKPIKAFFQIENELASAGLPIRPSEFLLGWALAAIVPSFLSYLFTANIFVFLGLLLIGLFLPPVFLRTKKLKRIELFEKQLVEAIAIMSSCLKSGLTLHQALISISKEMPEPISKEYARALREISLGSTLEKALMNMAERMNSQNYMMIVSAILIQRQIGGNLSEILTSITSTIKERFKMKSEIKVLTTTGRTSGKIIGILPVVLLLFFMLVNPSYVQYFFDSTAGITMLVVAALLEVTGFLIIRRIVNIKY
jgi:tight adherence protein B